MARTCAADLDSLAMNVYLAGLPKAKNGNIIVGERQFFSRSFRIRPCSPDETDKCRQPLEQSRQLRERSVKVHTFEGIHMSLQKRTPT